MSRFQGLVSGRGYAPVLGIIPTFAKVILGSTLSLVEA
jgi:hypothetical protein